eukprot:14276587-Alexandrium_andersonii.AAC.1
MSASLVGSEMCIRDRPSAIIGGVNSYLANATEADLLFVPAGRKAMTPDCLLYTSDAADDM